MGDGQETANPVEVAPGVTRVSVGKIAFDVGVKGSGAEILAAAGVSLHRVILSHAHVDHRGAANELARRSTAMPTRLPTPKATPVAATPTTT